MNESEFWASVFINQLPKYQFDAVHQAQKDADSAILRKRHSEENLQMTKRYVENEQST